MTEVHGQNHGQMIKLIPEALGASLSPAGHVRVVTSLALLRPVWWRTPRRERRARAAAPRHAIRHGASRPSPPSPPPTSHTAMPPRSEATPSSTALRLIASNGRARVDGRSDTTWMPNLDALAYRPVRLARIERLDVSGGRRLLTLAGTGPGRPRATRQALRDRATAGAASPPTRRNEPSRHASPA